MNKPRRNGPKTQIKKAINRILSQNMTDNAAASVTARGLSLEGYTGGYLDALYDILLVLNRVNPNRRNYWDDSE